MCAEIQFPCCLISSVLCKIFTPLSYLKTILMAADGKMFKGNLWTVSDLTAAVSTHPFSCSRRQKQEPGTQAGTQSSDMMQQIQFDADRPRFASITSFALCSMLCNWKSKMYTASSMPSWFSNMELFSQTSIDSRVLHAWDNGAHPFFQLLSRPPYLQSDCTAYPEPILNSQKILTSGSTVSSVLRFLLFQ